jgi:DNA recombination protein RmuC
MEVLIIILAILVIVNIYITLTKKTTSKTEEVLELVEKLRFSLERIEPLLRDEFSRARNDNLLSFRDNREELNNSFKLLSENLSKNITDFYNVQQTQFESYSVRLSELAKSFDDKTKALLDHIEKSMRENRVEQSASLKSFEEKFTANVRDFNQLLRQKIDDLLNMQNNIKQETEIKLKEIRETVEIKLNSIQNDSNKKLDEMRKTVDEKLQESINKRFNESFELISKRLEEVQQGLGEMKNLASDVGGLKRVLTNVKTRGTFGEVQLESLLEQILSPEQYVMQAVVKKNSQERVDAVVKLPGQKADNTFLLLPIDAKFPMEDYQRLSQAYEAGEPKESILILRKRFEDNVKNTAKNIASKYINPPDTTNFAVMFVPSESVYAEILRSVELVESLRRDFAITIVGPTNLAAFLSSLQMGFRTLAIQQRSNEVWKVLGAVKSEFTKFGDVLEKVSKNLQTASNTISAAGTRTRAIQKQLRAVEAIPHEQTELIEQSFDLEYDNDE